MASAGGSGLKQAPAANDGGGAVSATQFLQMHHLVPKIVSACAGSLVTSVVVNPFDVVRVRMQQFSAYSGGQGNIGGSGGLTGGAGTLSSVAASSLRPAPGKVVIPSNLGVDVCCKDVFWYPSGFDYCVASEITDPCATQKTARANSMKTWNVLSSIAKDEGPTALWRGLSAQLVQAIPANVVYFIAYEYMRDNSPFTTWPTLNPLICGGLARALATTSISPIELFKTRLQSAKGPDSFKAVMNSVTDLVQHKGVLSLWSGLSLTLWRDVPFSSIYWLIIEKCRKGFESYRARRSGGIASPQTHMERLGENAAAGIIGGLVASVATTPFDVGKTRKQLCHYASPGAKMHMLPFMASVVREEGWRALFVGMVPRMLKVAPACAIMITSYEMGKAAFQNDPKRET